MMLIDVFLEDADENRHQFGVRRPLAHRGASCAGLVYWETAEHFRACG